MDRIFLQKFEKDLEEFHITLSSSQIDQFLTYYEMLIEKNKVMNLTAIIDFEEVLKKHFVDSLSLVQVCNLRGDISLLDVGTGAGFPGMPLKIAFPNLRVTLLDSMNKRVSFLQKVIDCLELEDIAAFHGRAEDFAKPDLMREKFDICVSRAVANLSVLAEYCLPYVKVGGSFISYKSEKVLDEIEQAESAIKILGGKIDKKTGFTLPYSDIYRNLVVITKYTSTPKQYPRKAGVASKRPL